MPLSERDARKAAKYNRRKARRIAWRRHYPRIATLFGLNTQSVTKLQFAQAVHGWQAAQKPALGKDGKLGPMTWGRLKRELDQKVTSAPSIPIPAWLGGDGTQMIEEASAPATDGTPRWFQIAQEEKRRWDTEIGTWGPGPAKDHPERELDWDEQYFVASPRWGEITHDLGDGSDTENRDWCAAFVNYCLHRAGFSHTGSSAAVSFKSRHRWRFTAEPVPQQGCIIVIGNAATNHASHVAFLDQWRNLPEDPGGDVVKTSGFWYQLLGGNQRPGGRVSSKRYPSDLLAGRDRYGNISPYFMPEQGPHTCNIGSEIATERPHHCHYPANED